MPKLMGSIKIKADKDYKAGDEIVLDEAEVDVPQENFDRQIGPRLAREKKKIETLEAKVTELEEKEPENKTPNPTAPTAADKRLEKLETKQKELEAENKRLKTQSRIDAAIKSKAADLPEDYRELIRVGEDATDEEIEAAVQKANERFNGLKTKLGVKADGASGAGENKADIGSLGAGGTKDDPNDKRKPLVDKAQKNAPKRLEFLKNQGLDQEAMLATLEKWDKNGELEPKATAKV